MKNKNFKNISTTIAIALIFLMVSSVYATLPIKAQIVPGQGGTSITPDNTQWSTTIPVGVTPYTTIVPKAYLSFSPNPIGINQMLLVNLWLTSPCDANRYGAGYTVSIIKPDGTKDTVGPMHSYVADGTAWFQYIPDQVGTWQLKFDFPGQYYPAGIYVNGIVNNASKTGNNYPSEYYEPASTGWQNLTVQQAPIMSWYSPLPTGYWTRPVNINNREWSAISGNYPWIDISMGASMNGAARWLGPYTTASNSAHILWTQNQAFPAGIIGGEAGNYANTARPVTPSVIFEGRAYATQTVQWYNGSYLSCAVCYDLQTGKIYYEIPTATPYNGLTPTFINYPLPTTQSVPGADQTDVPSSQLSTLIGSQLYIINPMTGAITSNITCMSGLYHNGWVLSSQNLGNVTNPNFRILNWTTSGTGNFASRIVSNISSTFDVNLLTLSFITTAYPLSPVNLDTTNATLMNQQYYTVYQADLDAGISIMQGRFTNGDVNGGILQGLDLTTGKVLWTDTLTVTPFNSGTSVGNDGIYFCVMEQGIVQGFDERTGKLLWSTNTTEGAGYPWGEFWGYVQASAYGMFYACGYTGIIAFNETTGAIVWHFTGPTAPPFEEPYTYGDQSVYPFTSSPIVADGKIYIENNEHTPTAPYARGWGTYCVNATTGDLIWKVDNSMTVGAMSDGYTTAANSYDGSMYVFGKGQSATTVSAPQTQITTGTKAVISGTVMDLSAAQPNTPCISEASMGAWMSYLHLQSQIPSNVTGVPVSIDAIDPNGNPIHIGDTTSDMSGTFSYTWTPTMAGNYQITATFIGSSSYGSSWAETHTIVVDGQTTTAPTTSTINLGQTTTDSLAMYVVAGVIAIIIAIAIVGLVLLKKK